MSVSLQDVRLALHQLARRPDLDPAFEGPMAALREALPFDGDDQTFVVTLRRLVGDQPALRSLLVRQLPECAEILRTAPDPVTPETVLNFLRKHLSHVDTEVINEALDDLAPALGQWPEVAQELGLALLHQELPSRRVTGLKVLCSLPFETRCRLLQDQEWDMIADSHFQILLAALRKDPKEEFREEAGPDDYIMPTPVPQPPATGIGRVFGWLFTKSETRPPASVEDFRKIFKAGKEKQKLEALQCLKKHPLVKPEELKAELLASLNAPKLIPAALELLGPLAATLTEGERDFLRFWAEYEADYDLKLQKLRLLMVGKPTLRDIGLCWQVLVRSIEIRDRTATTEVLNHLVAWYAGRQDPATHEHAGLLVGFLRSSNFFGEAEQKAVGLLRQWGKTEKLLVMAQQELYRAAGKKNRDYNALRKALALSAALGPVVSPFADDVWKFTDDRHIPRLSIDEVAVMGTDFSRLKNSVKLAAAVAFLAMADGEKYPSSPKMPLIDHRPAKLPLPAVRPFNYPPNRKPPSGGQSDDEYFRTTVSLPPRFLIPVFNPIRVAIPSAWRFAVKAMRP